MDKTDNRQKEARHLLSHPIEVALALGIGNRLILGWVIIINSACLMDVCENRGSWILNK